MRFYIAILMALWAGANNLLADSKNDRLTSLLSQLDREILKSGQYKAEKETHIDHLKRELANAGLGTEKRYKLIQRITEAYAYYRCDSAKVYAMRQLQAAEASQKQEWINDSKIQLASILFKIAMFDASLGHLKDLEVEQLSEQQRTNYYKAYYEAHTFWLEYYDDGYADTAMTAARDRYYELFLQSLSRDSHDYITYYGIKQINDGEWEKAEKILQFHLPNVAIGTRSYSILNSVLGYLYRTRKDIQTSKAHLALSAISDIRGNIMENASLRELAEQLYAAGDLERANRYILKSMEDANFYNARIRNFQTLRVLQVINKAYEANQLTQRKELRQQLGVISLLSVVLMVGIFFIALQVRKVSRAKREVGMMNAQLQKKNAALGEANRIKEEYIGHFLALCSFYIEKLDKYQKKLFHKAKTGHTDELVKMIKSSQFVNEERAAFFEKFDDSFLRLFPDFVQQFNKLMPEGEKIILKPNEKLTTELRIFALIRLGINDSNKIAEFLHYSLATIYNYRSRYRNKSCVSRDEFEAEIMRIGTANANILS